VAGQPDVEQIAWRVLTDLCRPGGEFATLPPEGLERLIGLRLAEEARRADVDPQLMGEAFFRALRELTGADRPPRPAPGAAEDEPGETIDDL